MTYSESWPETVTRKEVTRELKLHSLTIVELDQDITRQDTYSAADILGWLGY